MSLSTSEMSPADFSAMMNNSEGFGGNGAWWLIILFLFFMWGGNRTNSGAMDNYVLNSDFSTLSRQLESGIDRLAQQGNSIANGLCDGFYTQAQLVNGVNSNILESANGIREAVSNVNYNMAMNSNALQSAVQTGFCQTNYNNQNNTRDIIDSQNVNTRAILDAINANKVEALKDRIAEQSQQISALQLSASQQAQNAYLIDQLGTKCPIPAYLTCNPNAPLNYSVNYGCGCGA